MCRVKFTVAQQEGQQGGRMHCMFRRGVFMPSDRGGTRTVKVAVALDVGGLGDLSFNDMAHAGVVAAEKEFKLMVFEEQPPEGPPGPSLDRQELIQRLSQKQVELVLGVGFLFTDAIVAAAAAFGDTDYGLIDGFVSDLTTDSNIQAIAFAEHEGSFLVGAAAALKSATGKVGFIGGVEFHLIQKFEAGYAAGAREVNAAVSVDVAYISQVPDFSGFNDPVEARRIALDMYGRGVDVIYHASGGSGAGLFEAAKEFSASSGTQVWAIGVDSDQFQAVSDDLKPHILTSMLKRVDVAVLETIHDEVEDSFQGGYALFDLATEGVGYSTSGGFVDDIVFQLEDLKTQIIKGDIVVPEAP